MARAIDKKALNTRIKGHKAEMKGFKKTVTDGLAAGMKGESIDTTAMRNAVSGFIKSHTALIKDISRLPTDNA